MGNTIAANLIHPGAQSASNPDFGDGSFQENAMQNQMTGKIKRVRFSSELNFDAGFKEEEVLINRLEAHYRNALGIFLPNSEERFLPPYEKSNQKLSVPNRENEMRTFTISG